MAAVVVGYIGINAILAVAITAIGFPEDASVVEEVVLEPGTSAVRVRYSLTNLPLETAVTYQLLVRGVDPHASGDSEEPSFMIEPNGVVVVDEGACERRCSGPQTIVLSMSNPSASTKSFTVVLEVSAEDGVESASLIELDVSVLDRS